MARLQQAPLIVRVGPAARAFPEPPMRMPADSLAASLCKSPRRQLHVLSVQALSQQLAASAAILAAAILVVRAVPAARLFFQPPRVMEAQSVLAPFPLQVERAEPPAITQTTAAPQAARARLL